MTTRELTKAQSVLLIVNRPSGTGRSAADLDKLRQAFETHFAPANARVFQVTEGHESVLQITREFLRANPGPHCLLAGGGGGTTRAVINGLLAECTPGSAGLAAARVGVLRLGSGNLIAKRLGMPADPVAGVRLLAEGLSAGRVQTGWAYRCTFHLPDGEQRLEHGLALGSLGQFARVPAEVEHWKKTHLELMRKATRLVPLEAITNAQYGLVSLRHAIGVAVQPGWAERIEVRQSGRVDQLRLLAGVLVHFDLPQIPVRTGCRLDEPRLTLGLLPFDSRRQLLGALGHWRDLAGSLRQYSITPEAPLEVRYVGPEMATVALDEDTITSAARRLTWEVVGPLGFITALTESETA